MIFLFFVVREIFLMGFLNSFHVLVYLMYHNECQKAKEMPTLNDGNTNIRRFDYHDTLLHLTFDFSEAGRSSWSPYKLIFDEVALLSFFQLKILSDWTLVEYLTYKSQLTSMTWSSGNYNSLCSIRVNIFHEYRCYQEISL